MRKHHMHVTGALIRERILEGVGDKLVDYHPDRQSLIWWQKNPVGCDTDANWPDVAQRLRE